MHDPKRRSLLKAGGALALTGFVAGPAGAADPGPDTAAPEDSTVSFIGDGINLSPERYSSLLARLAGEPDFERDVYASGGVVTRLEEKFAGLLGKEQAVFLPTGTLANHIALRRLTPRRGRVIVQADSHVYNDSGDCAQKLSGLNLVPVNGPFDPDGIGAVLARARSGRVGTPVEAISLESPLRRGFNTSHRLRRTAEVAAFARAEGLALHLDGARLFMQAAHEGFDPAEYAGCFDTVYVSLYKNFNAAGGAVLAGPAATLDGLAHERRMFGASPCGAWPLAAPALHFAESFIASYRRAREVAERCFELLRADDRLDVRPIDGGTNSRWLEVRGVDEQRFVENLKRRGILVLPPRPQWEALLLMINPTVARRSADRLAADFQAAARE